MQNKISQRRQQRLEHVNNQLDLKLKLVLFLESVELDVTSDNEDFQKEQVEVQQYS